MFATTRSAHFRLKQSNTSFAPTRLKFRNPPGLRAPTGPPTRVKSSGLCTKTKKYGMWGGKPSPRNGKESSERVSAQQCRPIFHLLLGSEADPAPISAVAARAGATGASDRHVTACSTRSDGLPTMPPPGRARLSARAAPAATDPVLNRQSRRRSFHATAP